MVRWAIAGPGVIAAGFAEAMSSVIDGEIVAVASRSSERAEAFCRRFNIPTGYDDYTLLATDPDVDVVYVATPQSRHEADTITFLEAGKHVLCEKPLALNASQARRMVDEASRQSLFLMEGIWSRFLPAYRALSAVLSVGAIGEPLLVEADFGFPQPFEPAHRLYDRARGGGALLDLGIYPLQLCSLVLGVPDKLIANGVLGQTGVDEQVAAVLHYPGNEQGVIKAAIRVRMACAARIAGTEGTIEIPRYMHCPRSISIKSSSGTHVIDGSYEGNGLHFEIEEVHRCLSQGLIESPTMPMAETVQLASTLDEIRRQIGLVFPGE
jgi:predicted dehydrogenase